MMGKALSILQHLKWFHNRFKNEDLSEWTIDCDDYNRIDEAIAELEEAQLKRREWYQKGYNEDMKPKTCTTRKYESFVGWMRGCEIQAWTVYSDGACDSHIDDDFCCNRHEPKEK